mmetsp:Transcript_33812/g.86415  ORF Transcript_33812/g.86415 Transcript_33812/m.86415 type:complete len:264 (-) Transcript_33812:362-1153(-)
MYMTSPDWFTQVVLFEMAELDPLAPAFRHCALRLASFTAASAVCCRQAARGSFLSALFGAARACGAALGKPGSGPPERSALGPLLQSLLSMAGHPGGLAAEMVAAEPGAARGAADLMQSLTARRELGGLLLDAARLYGALAAVDQAHNTPAACRVAETVARQLCLRGDTELHKIRSFGKAEVLEGAQAQAAHSFILSAVAVQSLSATLRAHYRALGHRDAECAVAGWSLLKAAGELEQHPNAIIRQTVAKHLTARSADTGRSR